MKKYFVILITFSIICVMNGMAQNGLKLKMELTGHESEITSIAYTDNNKTLLSVDKKGTLKLWDLSTGKINKTVVLQKVKKKVFAKISPDANYIAINDGDKIAVWNWKTQTLVSSFSDHPFFDIANFEFSKQSRYIISYDIRKIMIWEIESGEAERRIVNAANNFSCLALSDDLKYIVTGQNSRADKMIVDGYSSGNYNITSNTGGNIKLWDTGGNLLSTISGHNNGRSIAPIEYKSDGWYYSKNGSSSVKNVTISPNSKIIVSTGSIPRVTGTSDNTIIWDLESGRKLQTLIEPHNISIFSNDSNFVFLAGKSLRIFSGVGVWFSGAMTIAPL